MRSRAWLIVLVLPLVAAGAEACFGFRDLDVADDEADEDDGDGGNTGGEGGRPKNGHGGAGGIAMGGRGGFGGMHHVGGHGGHGVGGAMCVPGNTLLGYECLYDEDCESCFCEDAMFDGSPGTFLCCAERCDPCWDCQEDGMCHPLLQGTDESCPGVCEDGMCQP